MCIRDRGRIGRVFTFCITILLDRCYCIFEQDRFPTRYCWSCPVSINPFKCRSTVLGYLLQHSFNITVWYIAVSYTHLRAHETVLDLVCRLLLEKKKKKQK